MNNDLTIKDKLLVEISSCNNVEVVGTPTKSKKGELVLSNNSNSFVYKEQKDKLKKDKKYRDEFIKRPEIDTIDYNANVIGDRFDLYLKEPSELRNKFDEIVKGKGSEWKKITRVHSSSLCGFLHFCKINKENKFKVNKLFFNKSNPNLLDEDLIFDHVKFEFENKCVRNHNPSSVDVVLYNNNTILFIELKFSEYLNTTSIDVSKDYLDEYKELFNKEFKEGSELIDKTLVICKSKKKNMFKLVNKDKKNPFYIGGIKQMLSHVIGINNFICSERKRKFKNVLYMEVAFKFEKFGKEQHWRTNNSVKNKYENFRKVYEEVKKILTDATLNKNKKQKIIFADSLISYEELFKDNKDLLTENVKEFYRYK